MSFNGTFHENAYVLAVAHPATNDAASFPASGGYVNVQPYNRFMFLVHMGDFDTDGGYSVQSATSKSATLVALSGATKTDLANATDDNYWFSIEVETAKLPTTHRYVTLVCGTMTGSNDYWSAFFIGWEARHGTPSQSSGYDSQTVIAG